MKKIFYKNFHNNYTLFVFIKQNKILFLKKETKIFRWGIIELLYCDDRKFPQIIPIISYSSALSFRIPLNNRKVLFDSLSDFKKELNIIKYRDSIALNQIPLNKKKKKNTLSVFFTFFETKIKKLLSWIVSSALEETLKSVWKMVLLLGTIIAGSCLALLVALLVKINGNKKISQITYEARATMSRVQENVTLLGEQHEDMLRNTRATMNRVQENVNLLGEYLAQILRQYLDQYFAELRQYLDQYFDELHQYLDQREREKQIVQQNRYNVPYDNPYHVALTNRRKNDKKNLTPVTSARSTVWRNGRVMGMTNRNDQNPVIDRTQNQNNRTENEDMSTTLSQRVRLVVTIAAILRMNSGIAAYNKIVPKNP